MTEAIVQHILIEKFKELDGLVKNADGTYPEVAFPNEMFTRPDDGYWYELYFPPAMPIEKEIGSKVFRWFGIMQINICVPKGSGIVALNNRYESVAQLYKSDTVISGVRIVRSYRTSALEDGDFYVMPVTVEWQTNLEK